MKEKLTIAAFLTTLSTGALANLPAFEVVDKNQDGQISKQEAQVSEELVAVFVTADVNKDGMLNAAEYDAIK